MNRAVKAANKNIKKILQKIKLGYFIEKNFLEVTFAISGK